MGNLITRHQFSDGYLADNRALRILDRHVANGKPARIAQWIDPDLFNIPFWQSILNSLVEFFLPCLINTGQFFRKTVTHVVVNLYP